MPVGKARLLRGGSKLVDLPAGHWRAIYPWRGSLSVTRKDGLQANLRPGEGQPLGRAACRIEMLERDGEYFLWEIDGPEASHAEVPDGLVELLRYDMPRLQGESVAEEREAALRFERVDLNEGAETPRHTHRGSGLRVLIDGSLEADIDGHRRDLHPGDAWLEKGPGEAVIGRAASGCRTAFVRLLVLPVIAEGEDSFVLLEDDDAPRPRPAAYERFHEERVVL